MTGEVLVGRTLGEELFNEIVTTPGGSIPSSGALRDSLYR